MFGLAQPVLDGIKLFLKGRFSLEYSHKYLYKRVPVIAFMVMFLLLSCLPFSVVSTSQYQVLWLLIIFGVNSHLILISGWASQSKFAMIGRIRSLAQAVSFEMLATVVLLFPYLVNFVFT